MPIYEYECTNCGLHFERQQRVSDDPIQVCPNCAGRVRRVISPVGIIFKGSGFYVTDNRRSSTGTARKEKSPDSASSNGKVESTESSASTGEHEKPQSKSEQEKSQSKE
jgi:putative FmdB family regulatory protein